jgi:hypothetical protein
MSQRKSFLLRLDQKLWNELESWAKDEFRSVNGQIEYILKQAVLKRKGRSAVEKQTEQEPTVKEPETASPEETPPIPEQKPENQQKSSWVGFEDVPD